MKKSVLAIVAAVALVAVVSVVVVMSSDDGSRRQGAIEGSEAVALSWRGDWNEAAEYVRGNVVSVEGVSYVAEGEKLAKPEMGCAECGWAELVSADQAGTASTPTAATLTSPNGSFKIEVKDTGISLLGPNNVSVVLSADTLTAALPKDFKVQAGLSVDVKAGAQLRLESSSNAFFNSPQVTLGCTSGSRPLARINDTVSGSTIVSGSSKVNAC
jgi:hypothetical protein